MTPDTLSAVIAEMRAEANQWRGFDPVNRRTARQLDYYADRLSGLASAVPRPEREWKSIDRWVQTKSMSAAPESTASDHYYIDGFNAGLREAVSMWKQERERWAQQKDLTSARPDSKHSGMEMMGVDIGRPDDQQRADAPAGSFGYCAICYHPLDKCSHCDMARPDDQQRAEALGEALLCAKVYGSDVRAWCPQCLMVAAAAYLRAPTSSDAQQELRAAVMFAVSVPELGPPNPTWREIRTKLTDALNADLAETPTSSDARWDMATGVGDYERGRLDGMRHLASALQGIPAEVRELVDAYCRASGAVATGPQEPTP